MKLSYTYRIEYRRSWAHLLLGRLRTVTLVMSSICHGKIVGVSRNMLYDPNRHEEIMSV